MYMVPNGLATSLYRQCKTQVPGVEAELKVGEKNDGQRERLEGPGN